MSGRVKLENSLPKLRIFYVLEEIEGRNEEFTEDNYNWHRRLSDPTYDSILNHFTSYEEMRSSYREYKIQKGANEEEVRLAISSQAQIEDYARVNEINMKKVSAMLLGKVNAGTQMELDKLHNLLRNTSKSGNVFLNMMVYRQIERMANLIDALDLAEKRMYSEEVIKTVNPDKLFLIIEQISKSIQTTLKFIDEISNRKYGDLKNSGNNITINQINVSESKDKPKQEVFSKPTRDKIRKLAQQIVNQNKKKED